MLMNLFKFSISFKPLFREAFLFIDFSQNKKI